MNKTEAIEHIRAERYEATKRAQVLADTLRLAYPGNRSRFWAYSKNVMLDKTVVATCACHSDAVLAMLAV